MSKSLPNLKDTSIMEVLCDKIFGGILRQSGPTNTVLWRSWNDYDS